jgi:DNA-binding transcriptional LysR family regulator
MITETSNHGVELRHLRYFVAVADAGTFRHAAERMSVAQPTLSQQIRRLEELVGTPLLYRLRNGVRPTRAGTVLLEESRAMLSLLDHGISQTRQVAGLGRPRLRFALPPDLPDRLAVPAVSRLRATAAAAGADVVWLETPLDAEFTLLGQRRADAGLGWLTSCREALPDPIEVMILGEFEPEVWVPAASAGDREVISLDELAAMDVIHGPRGRTPVTWDAWLEVLREARPRFEFTDLPFRYSLPMTVAFAAMASRPTAVLTGPLHPAGGRTARDDTAGPDVQDMVRVTIDKHPLTATAVVAWNGDLPRQLQQVLFDTADAEITCISQG